MLYDFGPRLLKLRKDKNLTQQMVVERAKGFDPNLRLSDSVLGKYESDLAVPRLTEAAALADVLNVSLDYLTSGEKCNVLSLKELSPEQVQLLMDLTAYIRTKIRLAIVMLSACLLLFFREPIAYRVTSAILAVAVTLLISKLGFGMQ